jgi:hypothetical protein
MYRRAHARDDCWVWRMSSLPTFADGITLMPSAPRPVAQRIMRLTGE